MNPEFEKIENDEFLLLVNSLMTEVLILYRNQSIDLLCKSMDWFLCNRDLLYEKVNYFSLVEQDHVISSDKVMIKSYFG